MRILSGNLKGSKILTNSTKVKGSESFTTRPTSDRVKETLFNIIQHGFNIDFNKVSFLDSFSGSGAVGLEAISRGSSKVSFLDKDSSACACITKNLASFNLYENDQSNSFKILNRDFFDKSLYFNNKFDIVFLDPPYQLVKAREVFMRLKELNVTKINTLIIYESDSELVGISGLKICKSRKIGKTHLNFLKVLS